MKPRVFIGSSTESLPVAYAIQSNLDPFAEVTVWNQDIFSPSLYTLESLLKTVHEMHFGVFVFAPDDIVKFRDLELSTARDNVVFELGLFVAGVGRERTVIVSPRGLEGFHLPSDLMGLATATYDAARQDGRLEAALGPACTQIRKLLEEMGTHECSYLVRYVESEEPSLIGADCETRVSYERAYKLLLYLFKHEKFEQFRAFDLAFERWEELLRPDHMQTFNISNEIFDSMTSLFEQERCQDFRRILVISPEQLGGSRKGSASRVLKRILDQERRWQSQYGESTVETRVFLYPDKGNPETRRKIRQLHDFALFTGDGGNLAIVETTLTSPTDHVEAPECQLVTHQEEIGKLRDGFEEFWKLSRSISEFLDGMAGVSAQEDAGRPAFKAFDKFLDAYPGIARQSALIIEAGYFDLRSPDDEDRLLHLDDAFWLLESVRTSCQDIRDHIFLEAFINDFTSLSLCNIEPCIIPLSADDDEQRQTTIREIVAMLERKYQASSLQSEEFHTFSMRRTRNAVTEVMKKALKAKKEGIREEDDGDTTVDIWADSLTEPIYLGYRDADSLRITPRCTALMAQHYYDLYKFARQKRPHLGELWIFDFNRFTERDSVRLGAEASFLLHPWPRDFCLSIVNCIYSADGKTGNIQVVNGPA